MTKSSIRHFRAATVPAMCPHFNPVHQQIAWKIGMLDFNTQHGIKRTSQALTRWARSMGVQ